MGVRTERGYEQGNLAINYSAGVTRGDGLEYRGPILVDTLPLSLIVDEARARGLGTGGSETERMPLVRVTSVRRKGGIVESIWDWEG